MWRNAWSGGPGAIPGCLTAVMDAARRRDLVEERDLGRQWCFDPAMPVSKKRKKDGKPARRAAPPPQGEQPHGPEVKPASPLLQRMGKPSNPFVAQMPKRAAQRGR